MMFLDCPAYLDPGGALRCGLPAEVRCRFIMHSADGPVESTMIRCPAGHYFCGAIADLTWPGKNNHNAGNAAVTNNAGRHSVQGSHERRRSTDISAIRQPPVRPDPDFSRPSTVPPYYLGRPAAIYINAMRPRRRLTA